MSHSIAFIVFAAREGAVARQRAALEEIEQESSETAYAIAAIRLLMLTGCRQSEIQKLRWEHADLDAGELRLTRISHDRAGMSCWVDCGGFLVGMVAPSGR